MKKFISIIALACVVTSAYAADAPFNPKTALVVEFKR